MAIQTLNKVTVSGTKLQQDFIIDQLQSFGCMHLISLIKESNKQLITASSPSRHGEALNWLDRSPRIRRQYKPDYPGNLDNVLEEIVLNKKLIRQTADKRDKLIERMKTVRPWGEFVFPEVKEIDGYLFWFYVLPFKYLTHLESIHLPWQILSFDEVLEVAYVLVISKKEPKPNLLPVKRSHIGSYSLSKLETLLEEAEHKLEELYNQREALTKWMSHIKKSMFQEQNKEQFLKASSGALDEGEFFLIQGWVPENQYNNINTFCKKYKAAALFEKVGPDDNPPTMLSKNSKTGGGSDALGFFQIPNYRAWDPGNIVFYSFALFFAMIMSDVMYSLLFGMLVFLFKTKLRKTDSGARLVNLGYFMSFLGVVWGILIGSYFGVEPSSDWLKGMVFINLNHYNDMMRLSIYIGVAHLVIANIMIAWVNRFSNSGIAHAGWAVIMLGGLLVWLEKTNELPNIISGINVLYVLIIGIIVVFLFSSDRKICSVKDLIFRIIDGFKSVYNITAAFGDILSYMRLFALGLSGASLAMTFNSLAKEALASDPVLGVIFSGLILLLGHTLNFVLCIMSGVVHGMRLNVIEFLNWGLSEEGYPFKTFKKKGD